MSFWVLSGRAWKQSTEPNRVPHLPPNPRRTSGGSKLVGNRKLIQKKDQSLLETCPERQALEPQTAPTPPGTGPGSVWPYRHRSCWGSLLERVMFLRQVLCLSKCDVQNGHGTTGVAWLMQNYSRFIISFFEPYSFIYHMCVCVIQKKIRFGIKLNSSSILVTDQLCPWTNNLHLLSFSWPFIKKGFMILSLENYYKDK